MQQRGTALERGVAHSIRVGEEARPRADVQTGDSDANLQPVIRCLPVFGIERSEIGAITDEIVAVAIFNHFVKGFVHAVVVLNEAPPGGFRQPGKTLAGLEHFRVPMLLNRWAVVGVAHIVNVCKPRGSIVWMTTEARPAASVKPRRLESGSAMLSENRTTALRPGMSWRPSIT